MLYHLLYPLHTEVSLLNVTQYITFRTAAASYHGIPVFDRSRAFGDSTAPTSPDRPDRT